MIGTSYLAFAVVTPNLEALLNEELRELGIKRTAHVVGGVEFRCDREQLWRIAHFARIPEAIRVRLGTFKAHSFDEFEAGLQRLPWNAYFRRQESVRVSATCKKSALYHSDAVAQRTAAVIAKRLGGKEPEGTEWPQVFVRMSKDTASVSVNATGERLHKRGYRIHIGRAPLRETLAAALIRASGCGAGPLWDPFCGSGTLIIEGLLSARNAPTTGRRYAFEAWPTHDQSAYSAMVSLLVQSSTKQSALASDIDQNEVAAARSNSARAGVGDAVQFEVGDFGRVVPPKNAVLITNLPYGKRAGVSDELFRRFGTFLDKHDNLQSVFVLTGSPSFEKLTARKWRPVLSFSNRGVPVRFLALVK